MRITWRRAVYLSKDPQGWTYTPNWSQPALDQNLHTSTNVRLTWQVIKNNKISFAPGAPESVPRLDGRLRLLGPRANNG
jgi:hypothetical protein